MAHTAIAAHEDAAATLGRPGDKRRMRAGWLTIPFGLVLGPMSGVAWELGADNPSFSGPAWLGVWLAHQAFLAMGDAAPPHWIWGALHGLSMVLTVLTVQALRLRWFQERGRRGSAVIVWSMGIATALMVPAYVFGVGWPGDLLGFLVAAVASFILGVRILARSFAPSWMGWTLTAGNVAALAFALWWCHGYVPGFVALGLTVVWGTVGFGAARNRA